MISNSLLKHKFAGIFLEPAGCSRLNMDETSSDWIPAASMNHWHGRRWQMVSLGKKAYAMGGFRDYSNSVGCPVDIGLQVMERYDEDTNMWTDVAPYPINIHNHCMAPDEETGRIWVIGGRYISGTTGHDTGDLRYYEVDVEFIKSATLNPRRQQTPGMETGTCDGIEATTRVVSSNLLTMTRRGSMCLEAGMRAGG